MTNLDVPAIKVGVKHPYWRQKDTWGPSFVTAQAEVFTGVSIPSGTKGGNTYGDGKTGKRLWIMSPLGWVRVPYGYGNVDNIATVNVYDKNIKRWRTADWQFKRTAQMRTQPAFSPFDVRVKGGQVYDSRSGENTNYDYLGSSLYPENSGYLRLFYTTPRADPEWRVFDLLRYWPTHPPSTMVQGSEYSDFGQRGGRVTGGYYTVHGGSGQIPYDSSGGLPYWDFPFNLQYSDNRAINILASADAGKSGIPDHARPGFQYQATTFNQTSGMIDLKAIREQMLARFPNSLPDYTGSYDHMLLNHTQRVTIFATIDFEIQYGAGEGDVADVVVDEAMRPITFRLFYDTNYPGLPIADNQIFPMTYGPRYPSSVAVSGTQFFSQQGVPGSFIQYSDPFNTHYRYIKFSRTVVLNLEGPGEDNIRFSATVDNIPEPQFTSSIRKTAHDGGFGQPYYSYEPALYPLQISASITMTAGNIWMYYSLPNRDATADYKLADDGLGDFVVGG